MHRDPAQRTRPRYGARRRSAPGSPPGTLVIDPESPHPQLHLIGFGPAGIREDPDVTMPDVVSHPHAAETLWLHVAGLGDTATLRAVGERFALHPLALEDVVNVHQRPKFEDYGQQAFVILRVPAAASGAASGEASLHTEQVALCLGRDAVLTFQETTGETFEPVRQRLRNDASQLRRRAADYLAYALIDAAVDAYFPLLEAFGERLEELESEVVERPASGHMRRIHDLKRDLLTVRRAVWPMRDMLAAMVREEHPLVSEHTRVYLRDCHDHAVQLIDMIETYREIASGLVDIHLASVSNRMNEVMKVLTVIATIFIPLTFVVGVYGMNFDTAAGPYSMPELASPYGYPTVLAAMLVITVGLVAWFRRKGWIGGSSAT